MTKHPEILVLRHGETVWNREGRLQGQRDSPLTELGKSQALTQRTILGGHEDLPHDIFVSPLGRTIHTARLALGLRTKFQVDERLKEIGFGAWEGQTKREIRAQFNGDIDEDTLSFGSPDGETYEELRRRVSEFLADLSRPAVIVTHGATSSVLRGVCLGLDRAGVLGLSREQGCVFQVKNGKERILRQPTSG